MTQKERLLHELTRAPDGLTAVQLRELTGFAEASLRTTIWEMRRSGWIDVIGGVRGRYRYGVTAQGQRQAPAQTTDGIAEALLRAFGAGLRGPAGNAVRLPGPAEPGRQVLAFVRWLAKEHRDLLAGDPDATLRLEDAAADFLYQSGHVDAIKRLLDSSGLGQGHDDR